MDLHQLQSNWNSFGEQDPLWAILTEPDKKGRRWDPAEFFATGQTYVAGVLQLLETLQLRIGRRRALDFGCGVGRLTQALAPHFAEVSGVDIARSMIQHAETYNRHGTRCRYFHNPQDNLRLFGEGTFDLILTALVLQHMRADYVVRYLREFLRILTPQGALVFQLPQRKGPPPRIRRPTVLGTWLHRFARSVKQPRMEMYGMVRDQVCSVLEAAGGRIAHVEPDDGVGPEWTSYTYVVTKP